MNEVWRRRSDRPFKEIIRTKSQRAHGFSAEAKSEFFAIIDKLRSPTRSVAIFATPEKKTPGAGGVFAIFVSDLCKGCGVRPGLRRSRRAAHDAGDRRLNAEHDTGTGFPACCPTRRRNSWASTTTRAAGFEAAAAQSSDGAPQLRSAGLRRRRLRRLR